MEGEKTWHNGLRSSLPSSAFLSEVSHSSSIGNDLPRELFTDDMTSIISIFVTQLMCFLSQELSLFAFGCYSSYHTIGSLPLFLILLPLLLLYIYEGNWVICSIEPPTFWICTLCAYVSNLFLYLFYFL